jgi:DNA polymerase-1
LQTADSSNSARIEKENRKPFAFDSETTGVNAHTCDLLGVSTYFEGKATWSDELVVPENILAIGQNIKYDLNVLRRYFSNVPDAYFDTQIAYYLLHIDKSNKLENMALDLFKHKKPDLIETYCKSTGDDRKTLPEDWYLKIKEEDLVDYAMADAEWTMKIYERLSAELKEKPELEKWFFEVEMPIVNILHKMESKGVKIDRARLASLKTELTEKRSKIEAKLKWLIGDKDFNLNSPKQLQELLFNKLKLPVVAKTATKQPSTDKDALFLLVQKTEHAIPSLLLQFKEIDKILSTYTDSILAKLDDNDRLHTNYNQALTSTRRFSSDNPNLQNIPTRSGLGKIVKGTFVPKEGCRFLIADYSQLEPRILAHKAQDAFLIDCFKNERDIYEHTAGIAKQGGFDFNRDKSKILFLALMYGKSAWGLAQDWHCTEEEAKNIIQTIYSKLTGVEKYIKDVEEQALKTGGWLKSLAGLPLYVGNPYSNNKWEYAGVMRCCANYPIQSSSQDILKKAMVNIYQKLGLVPVLMVHDELVFELPNEDIEAGIDKKIIYEMEHAWELLVPLKASYVITDKWEKA